MGLAMLPAAPTNSLIGEPRVFHVVVSLAPGGLERLVVDWTNARNRRWPGSTSIVCLDTLGDLAPQVEGGCVTCLQADRSRSPWDGRAVATLKAWLSEQSTVNGEQSAVYSGHRKVEENGRVETAASTVHCSLFTVHSPPVAVLHAHNLAAWQYAVLATRGTGMRTVYTQHGANTHNQRLRDRLRCRALAFMTDDIVAVSKATAEAMTRLQWIPKRRIRVIVNGIDAVRFQCSVFSVQERADGGESGNEGRRAGERSTRTSTPHVSLAPTGDPCGADVPIRLDGGEDGAASRLTRRQIRDTLAIPQDAIVIGSVGRLAQVKGYDRLIEALGVSRPVNSEQSTVNSETERQTEDRKPNTAGEKAKEHPTCSPYTVHCSLLPFLLLVGDGPERAALETQARSLGIADRVRFAGFQTDPAPYLAAMDAFVLPSRSEGLSISLLEAMAAGVPVFVTDAGASREVIEDGKCGTLLPAREREWMATVGTVLASDGRAADLAARARERVVSHYSLDATLEAYEALYRRSMGTSTPH